VYNMATRYKKNDFKYSKDKGVWHNATINHPPSTMILNERMVNVGPGVDCWGFSWSGSTLSHWHCIANMSFDEAYAWVKGEDVNESDWFERN